MDIKIPNVGESINEVEISDWLKKEGDAVRKDEVLLVIESDKATVEISAPAAGRLDKIIKPKRTKVAVGEIVGTLAEGVAGAAAPAPAPAPAPKAAKAEPAPKPAKPAAEPRVMPAAARAMAEKQLTPAQVQPTGPGGRILKEDVQRAAAQPAPAAPPPAAPAAEPPAPAPAPVEPAPAPAVAEAPAAAPAPAGERSDEVVPMTLLRRRIAERLVHAKQDMAMLTTFNEVDMSGIAALRARYQEQFKERYGIKLGMMSFFVKAVVESLREFPAINAEIRGTDIVYHNYYDIGIAVGGGKGLVVPVLRNADRLSLAEIEQSIADFAKRIKENKVMPQELQGGTFTITNGGVFGSLLSTPIINPPQCGVLGLHSIQDRPVAVNGQVVIRPMMYAALTYDHRIVDGREAVLFLRHIKEIAEDPVRLLIEV